MANVVELLRGVERGEFPPADGGVSVWAQPSARDAAVVAFTAHNVVVADVDPEWVREQLPDGDLAAPLNPPFLTALCRRLGRQVNNIDMIATAPAAVGPPPIPLTEVSDRDHPRARRALRHRDDVRMWATDGGVVLIGRGLAGRWEAAVEVEPAAQGRGLGRQLAAAARHLVPHSTLWAQIAPGNAASVRAFLAAGFTPVGAEALLVKDD